MKPHPFLLLVATSTLGCGGPSPTTSALTANARGDKAIKANAFIDATKAQARKDHWVPSLADRRAVIEKALAGGQIDLRDLFDGCVELLDPAKELAKDREKVVRFLGDLGNQLAIPMLLSTLRDPEEDVRFGACRALDDVNATGLQVEAELVRVCRTDTSMSVRVAAAQALPDSREEDAVATWKFVLESKDRWGAETSARELEGRHKLEWPYPDHVHEEIDREEYLKIKRYRKVEREIEKNGTIYFEEVRTHVEFPPQRKLYRSKATADDK